MSAELSGIPVGGLWGYMFLDYTQRGLIDKLMTVLEDRRKYGSDGAIYIMMD